MTKNIGIVLGVYVVSVFAVFVVKLVAKLEDGLVTGDAFSAAIGAGLIWPITLITTIWN